MNKTIKLPINYTLATILRINDQYTPEEIAFNKLDVLIKNNIDTIRKDVDKLFVILKKYSIGRNEIEEFVFEKINYQPKNQTNHEK